MRRIAILGLLVLLVMVAIPAASALPDLNVTDIDVNPSNTSTGDAIFVNQSNQINATVYNAGPDNVAGDFDVCFYNNSVKIGTETVTGLAAGTNTTVSIHWTPSCVDYPGLSGDYLAVRVPTTLNVIVDCNGAVNETYEDNNTLLLNTEVSASGYKSKNFDCNPTDPLTTFKYAGDLFTGGLVYNVSGRKTCTTTGYPTNDFAPGNTTTRVHHIDLPSTATVKDARLYIVWYDDFGNPSPGFLANLSVDFTGPCGSATSLTMDDMYTDSKAYGTSYNLPKGKYAYNVTSLVCNTPSNDYTVTVENIDPVNPTVLLGGILVVVYEGGDEAIQLWWQEGCDLLSGRTKYGSSTTGATATVAFPGSIDLASIDSAELITFVDQGMVPESNMLFNGINIKTDAWDAPTEAGPKTIGGVDGSKINVENESVSVLASGNNMGFQDTGTAGMQANLAFLIVEMMSPPNATVYFEPSDSGANHGDTTTVGIWADTSEVIKGGNLYFDYTVGCANVTGYTPNDGDWDFLNQANLGVPGKVSIGFGTLNALGRGPGLLHIGDLEIQCCDVAYCKTDLVWNATSKLNRLEGGLVDPLRLEDGTFTCTNLPDLVVTDVHGEQQGLSDDYIVHYTVENVGNADAAAGHTATLHIGELATPGTWTWIEDQVVPVALAPGAFYEGTFNSTLTMTTPNDLMKVCADTGGDVMELNETNNCMESFYPAGIEIKVDVLDDGECVDFQEQFLVNITVDPRNIPVYGVQYTLSFNNSVLHAEWQNEGTFLSGPDSADTNVYINNINNGAGTISFAATRMNTPDGVTAPGTLAVIKFTAILQGGSSNLNLSGVIAANNVGGKILPIDLIDDAVCVWSNQPPVAIGKSMFLYNNDGQKYLSTVYFNGSDSYDPDGVVIYWRWSFGDGEYGTGELKDHVYRSWHWNGSGYDPFTATLTVTDDGDPHELDNTTLFEVIVYTAGDANGDGEVDILDATIVGLEWDETANFNGDLYWHDNPRGDMADLNNDGIVDILDAVIIGTCWGHTAW